MKYSLILCFIAFLALESKAQREKFGYGLTVKHDLYTRYANPTDNIASRSAGSALMNIGFGPKVWFGINDFAFSPEASFMFSPFALSSGDYKGLGAISIPILAKFEFLGNSNLNKDGKFGFSIGGGIQYSKSELFYLKPSFKKEGVTRSFYRTYIIEADFGYGMSGFDAHFFVRYGWSNNTDANTLNIGMGYDLNAPKFKKDSDPEF